VKIINNLAILFEKTKKNFENDRNINIKEKKTAQKKQSKKNWTELWLFLMWLSMVKNKVSKSIKLIR